MLQTKTKLSKEGRILVPAAYRKALGLKGGDEVLLVLDEGQLSLIPVAEAIRQAQALVRKYVPAGESLVDELIAERRQEARRE